MVTINEILEEFETKQIREVQRISNNIIKSDELINISEELLLPTVNPSSDLYSLKYYLYDKKEKEELFKLLEKNNYNKEYEIKDLIVEITNYYSNKNNYLIKNKYINSPYIDKIDCTPKYLEIESKELGNYSMQFASDYFSKNRNVSLYISQSSLLNKCHKHVEFLINNYPELYSITSLCTSRFNNLTFYHSYCYLEKSNLIIDLTHNLIMNKNEYDRLFKTEEVFRVKGKDLNKARLIATKYDLSLIKKYKAISATLFQQYIWENGFKSPDKDIFTEKANNPKLLMKNRFKSEVLK